MNPDPFFLILAPMDGVTDAPMREVLTSVTHYEYSVTEFIRVNDLPVPESVLLRKMPELKTGSRTASGTPVRAQLLGESAEPLVRTAERLVALGAAGIDLNFGCPAKQVVRSGGGSAVLKDPELLYSLTAAVRDAVPPEIPFSAKMRLGFSSPDSAVELAGRLVSAGVDELTVHGRTRDDEYLPGTVKWGKIREIRVAYPELLLNANGDVFDKESAERCSSVTGTERLMLGRGAIYLPNLPDVIRGGEELTYPEALRLVIAFAEAGRKYGIHLFPRIKQFLAYLRVHYEPLRTFFREVCRAQIAEEALPMIEAEAGRAERVAIPEMPETEEEG